jgi:hypothetical protein
VDAPIGGAEKKADWLLDGNNAELATKLPDSDPFRTEHMPVLETIEDLSWLAYQCRCFNRAFGTVLPPGEIKSLVPDETLDLIVRLIEHDQIGDSTTLLRLYLDRGDRAG